MARMVASKPKKRTKKKRKDPELLETITQFLRKHLNAKQSLRVGCVFLKRGDIIRKLKAAL